MRLTGKRRRQGVSTVLSNIEVQYIVKLTQHGDENETPMTKSEEGIGNEDQQLCLGDGWKLRALELERK
jgi:hypothetical protein